MQFSPEELIEIRSLFKEASNSVFSEKNLVLSADQIGLKLNFDEVILLFELAEESFSDDAVQYIDNVFISEQKKVEASSITKALQTFENTLQKRFFSLKKAPSAQTAAQGAAIEEKPVKRNPYHLIPIGWGYGLLSFIIDLCVVFFLSIFASYLFLPEIPQVWTSLAGNEQYLYYLPVTCGLLPLLSFAYLFVFALNESPTLGISLVNGDIVGGLKGTPLNRFTLATRASIAPFSYLLLGFLSPILGQHRMHDVIMGTRIVRKIPKAKRGRP